VIHVFRRDEFVALGSVRLPAGARQGPGRWYVGRMRLRVALTRLDRGGHVYVSADTRHRTFCQIVFSRRADGALEWETFDLFSGDRVGVVRNGAATIDFENYLQDKGVRPGLTDVRLHVEAYGGTVSEIRVSPASGILSTRRSPEPLAAAVRALDPSPVKGKTFRLETTVGSSYPGDVLKDVAVNVSYDPHRLAVVGRPPATHFAALTGLKRLIFTFKALAPGQTSVGFAATSQINGDRVGVSVRVGSAADWWTRQHLAVLIAGALLIGTGAALILRARS
jgi:hypothetical protein